MLIDKVEQSIRVTFPFTTADKIALDTLTVTGKVEYYTGSSLLCRTSIAPCASSTLKDPEFVIDIVMAD